ncbi:hypothetical protein Ancab_009858 [Ancistrocladus abbreviatus]
MAALILSMASYLPYKYLEKLTKTRESKSLLESHFARTSQYWPVPLSMLKFMPSRMASPSGWDVEEVPLRKLFQSYVSAYAAATTGVACVTVASQV